MALLNGSLQLLKPSAARGQRLPIDFFFRSLAQDQRERAIGIVLSGTGTDGTLGVRAIKGENGLVIAQNPESAEFDGMPRSAIATGLADYVIAGGFELLFGVASFHGTDPAPFAMALAQLHHAHLAPAGLRARALPANFQPMDLVAPEAIDQRAAMLAMPPLIKAYLRLGGHVGEGAWIDRDFNTTDVFLMMDTARLSQRHRDLYARGAGGKA